MHNGSQHNYNNCFEIMLTVTCIYFTYVNRVGEDQYVLFKYF